LLSCIRNSIRRVIIESGQDIRKYINAASRKRCMGRKDIIARSLVRSMNSGVEIKEQMEVSLNSGGRMM